MHGFSRHKGFIPIPPWLLASLCSRLLGKQKNNFMLQNNKEFKEFNAIMEKMAYRRGFRHVFADLLDLAILPLVIRDDGKLCRNPLEDYGPDEQLLFRRLLILLGDCMDGFADGLGDIFMEQLSFGKNGQFFTPQPICDMMAQMVIKPEDCMPTYRVADCACGSGRMLLAAAKIYRGMEFYGSDVDLNCVKMAVINLAYNSLVGEVHWMNTLSLEHWGSFRICIEPFTKLPYIITFAADRGTGVAAIKEVAAAMPESQKEQVAVQLSFLDYF